MSQQEPQVGPEGVQQPIAEDGDVFFIVLQYKGNTYNVPVQVEDTVASIFDFVQEVLDFPRENCKLICRGKMLRPDHDGISVEEAGLAVGSKLMLVASSAHDVSFVQSSRADPLVKGFVEEERDERNRRKRARAAAASAWGTKQDAEYCFVSIKAEFKYTEPTPFEAERLLQKLSTDPGVIDIMKARQFKVGILTEMSPVEAQERMAKRGTPNMDLLGYNQNMGEMIVLRLRTDNLKGFRPYHDLINTLLHELTHNVWGAHDHNFWKLYGELKAQYMRFHRFWSHGGQASSSSTAQFQGFVDCDEEGTGTGSSGFGRVLGAGEGSVANAKAQAAAAAEARFRRASDAAAAEAAEEAASGSGQANSGSGFPNFLAGDGSWTFVCPCGQVHDFKGMCDAGAATAAAAGASTPSLEASANGTAGVPGEAVEAVPAELSLRETAVGTALEASDAADPLARPPISDVVMGSTEVASSPEPMEEVPLEPAAADEAMGAAPPEAAGEAEDEPGYVAPGLDLGELAEHGLDGAALWLHRFEELLRTLQGSSPGRPQAREAMAVLLRLVRNVVDSPHEQKFRRIRADNPRVRTTLLNAGAEVEALITLLGFEAVTESGERIFLLRDAVFDCARLRMGQELLERELSSAAASVR